MFLCVFWEKVLVVSINLRIFAPSKKYILEERRLYRSTCHVSDTEMSHTQYCSAHSPACEVMSLAWCYLKGFFRSPDMYAIRQGARRTASFKVLIAPLWN